jgi:suppressor for copper-sensitivity B
MAIWRCLVFLAVLIGVAGSGTPVYAMASDWSINDQGQLRLISAVDGVGDGRELPLGLQFRMQPGWKIYWRSPGDAGFPPDVDWSKSENLDRLNIAWPVPRRFSVLGFETLGYKDEVVLPLQARVATPGQPVQVNVSVRYLTCAEICVPQQATLSLKLPRGPVKHSVQANLLARYNAQVPREGARHGMALDRAAVSSKGEELILRVHAEAAVPFDAPDLLVEGPEGSFFSRPRVSFSDDRKMATLTVEGGGIAAEKLDGKPLRFTLVDGNRAMERELTVRLGDIVEMPLRSRPGDDLTFLSVLLLAVLGGLILNLMPCVLPVLSIKLLKVVGHGGADRGAVRVGFLASAAGILFSFMVLATVLVGLKASGMAIGWGIQFQQPVFLVAIAAILTLFACNLFGLFEFHLPSAFAGWAARHSHGRSLVGHFMTGALATLLATPCSAPFLGTAVGFALSRGATEIYAVFFALGIGLAIPFLAIAAMPSLATRLPRPGAWMVKLRRVLAVALVGTAVWLLSVLYVQSGPDTTLAVGFLLLLVPMVYTARRIDGARFARHATTATAILVAAAIAVPIVREPLPAGPAAHKAGMVWRPFDEAAIADHVRNGKVVLVDVTADWCITCQVNKTLVLGRGQIASLTHGPAIIAMRADWTRPDPKISNYLAKFGRFGIPFNVVYGPLMPHGIVLPELLTEKAVLGAISEAARDKSIVAR